MDEEWSMRFYAVRFVLSNQKISLTKYSAASAIVLTAVTSTSGAS